MINFRKWIATLPLAVTLITPVATFASDHDRDDRNHRYYDNEYKDYHNWNADEQRYWRGYWANERRPYVDWDRASDEQRRAYWRWRHEQERHHHGDHDRDRR